MPMEVKSYCLNCDGEDYALSLSPDPSTPIELLICEAGQHDPLVNLNGENIAEALHRESGLPIKYTEDYVHVSPLFGPTLDSSPTATTHGWQWLR